MRAVACATLVLACAASAQVPDLYGTGAPSGGIVIRAGAAPASAPPAPTAPPPAAAQLPALAVGRVWNARAEELTWERLRGRVVLLDFFSFTCKPCLKAMPEIVKLQATHRDRLRVIGYHIGRGGAAEIEPIVKRFAIDYPVIATPEADDPKVAVPGAAFLAQFGSELLPCASVIGADGRLRAWNLPPDRVAAAVDQALSDAK